jgi:sugar lactone lactonase YvrE
MRSFGTAKNNNVALSAIFSFSLLFAWLSPPVEAQTTPSPSITLTASASEVAINRTARISFKVSDATRCVASGPWQGEFLGDKTKSGSVSSLALTERVNTFVLDCQGPGGTASRSVTVLALPAPVVEFSSDRDRAIPGESIRLTWVARDAQSCSASGAPFTGTKPISGSETLSGLTKGIKKFALSCRGVGGTTRANAQVAVVPAPTLDFTARATQLPQSNSGTQLKWKATDATSCVASGDWSGEKGLSGTAETGSLSTEKTYTLSCVGLNGDVEKTLTVEVVPAPTVSLSLSDDVVAPGESVRILWDVTDAQSCSASGAPFSGSKSPTNAEEVLSGLTKGAKIFKLTCKGGGGTTVAEAKLTVIAKPSLTFSASKSQIAENTGTSLKWKSTDATSCVASDDWSGEKGLSGTAETGLLVADKIYTLKCVGLNGEVEQTVKVEVVPAPVVELTLSEDVVAPGESVLISWAVTDAQTCTASGAPFSGSKDPTSSSETLSNLTKGAKTFKLTCKGGGGTTAAEAKMTVIAKPTLEFSARASQLPQTNTGTQLKWKATDATTCTASGAWSGTKDPSGTFETGALTKDFNDYGLQCTGLNGEVSKLVTVEVVPAPVITLELSKEVVAPGESVKIFWSVTDAKSCSATGAPFTGNKDPEGGEEVLSGLTKGTKTFKLTCQGGGGSISADVKLPVFPPPTLELTASSTKLAQNNKGTLLRWKTTDATSCVASGAWGDSRGTAGTFETGVLSREINDYELTCVGVNGEVTKTISIEIFPPPFIEFELSASFIEPNDSVELIWSSLYAESCSATGAPWSGSKPLSGSETLSGLSQGNKLFKLTCKGPGGTEFIERPLAVFPIPTIKGFAPAKSEVMTGSSTTLSWQSEGTDSCTASGDWTDPKPTSSPVGGSPTPTLIKGTYVFRLLCKGPGGEASAETRVGVIGTSKTEFSSSLSLLATGQSAVLRWQSADAVRCEASGDWSGSKPLSGEESVSSNSARTLNFKLRCINEKGDLFDEKSLSIEVIQPELKIAPLTLAFDPRAVGSESNPRVLTIENTRRVPVNLGSPILEGDVDDFIFQNVESCGDILPPLGTCSVKVSFKPQAGGNRSLRARVPTNGAAAPILLEFNGVGLAPRLTISTTRLEFGVVAVGATSEGKKITLKNEGTASARVDNVDLTGDATAYSVKSACAAVLDPNSTCEIVVTFAPKSSGEKPGSVIVSSGSVKLAVSLWGYAQSSPNRNETSLKNSLVASPGVIASVAGSGPIALDGDGGPAVKAGVLRIGGLAVAGNGDVLFVDGYFIRCVERSTGLIRSIAGTGSLFFDGDGRAATATAMSPGKLVVDAQGEVYFADRGRRIRRIDSAGVVTTIAGTGEAGNTGDGGPATAAKILVADMVRDGEGSLYFADPQNAKIRKISATGIISTLSLTNVPSGFLPSTLAVNPSGVLHVYDQRNLQVWRVDPQTSALSLVAGTGTRGLAGDGGPATAAQLFNLGDLAFDSTGNLYLSDINVRVINASTGVIKTIALGTATSPDLPTLGGLPREVLAIANGKLLVGVDRSDLGLQIKAQIVSLDLTSLAVTVVAGRNEQAGYAGDGGSATAARIYAPTGLTLDAQGNLFIGDRMNGRLRRVDAQTGVISTLATGEPNSQTFGLRYPTYTAVAPNGDVYYSEWRGNRVMKYSPKPETVSVVAGTGTAGFTGDGGPATSAQISQPWGLAVDEQGNLYVGTSYRIRKIDPSGVITTIAGCCDGPSTTAEIESFTTPIESVVATSSRILSGNIQLAYSKGKLLFSDFSGGLESADVLRELDLTSGRVRRIAGNGTQGQTLFKGQALNSSFGQIFGVAADSAGNWYVSDVLSNTISRINPTSGEMQTIAGGRQGYDGDGGTALGAALNTPQGLAFDRRGNLYLADRSNQLVRVVLCAAPPESGEVSDCDANAPSTSRRRTLVQWNQVGVDQCEAVGAWSGPRAISGAEWLSVPSSGEQVYALRCTKADGSVSLLENVIKDGAVTSKLPKTAKLDQTSLFFGQTPVGQVSSTQTLRVQNTGSNALTVEVGLVGAGAASFTTTSCGAAIVAGGSCEIRVAFAPKSSGEQVAQVEVTSGLLKLLATVSGNGSIAIQRDQASLKIIPAAPRGVIATVAGSGPAAIEGDGGLAVKAGVSDVGAMVFASNGDVLFVDGYYIRRVERATGLIRRFAGTGSRFFDGDGRAATATAMAPGRLIVSSQGDVYFADQASRIRRIDSAGVVTTIAGTGEGGNTGDGGPATAAKILVADMARDAAGNLFFADPEAAKIRKISATGEISTLSLTNVPSGFVPSTLAVNPSGVLHVYDQRNFRLWRVDPQTSALSLVAGTGTQGLAGDGGPATAAQLYNLGDVAFDSAGNLYLSDANVRSINVSTGVITTIAFGTASSSSLPTLGGFPGPLLASSNGQLLIGSGIGDGFQISAQMFNLDLSSKVLTLVAGRGDRAGFAGDGGRATSARFYAPTSVVADAQGNLFVGDRLNGRVRRIDAQTGLVSTVAVGAPTSPTIGQRFPTFTAVAANGDVYYSEWRGHRVMKYSPQTQSVTVVAGTGTAGFSGDGGQATAARLALPWGLAFDEQQNLYISTDGRIRRVATNGVITTVAGCCDSISDAVTPLDGVPALSARLNGGISQLAYRNGKLYFADAANGAIANPVVRELDLASGLIRTIAGNGTFGQSLTNGRALNSPLGQIFGVTTDSSGNVYISETTSSRISRINPTTGEITAIAGGRLGYDGDGGSALDAALYTAQGISFDRRGNLYFADRANHLIRVVLCAAPPESGEASDCDANAPSTSRRRTLVQWNQVGVDQCEAVGAWSGPRAISGAEWLSVPSSGEQVYALRCTKADGSVSLLENVIKDGAVTSKLPKTAKLDQTSLFFGQTPVGQVSSTQTLRVQNTGSNALTVEVGLVGAGAASFTTTSCGAAIVAGGSCEIRVAFAPKSSGEQVAQVEVTSGLLKLLATVSGNGSIAIQRDQASLKIIPAAPRGVIATVAGSGPAAIEGDGGLAVKAGVSDVGAMVFASNGDVLFVDGYYIRRVERATGLIRRFAGTGSRFFDGDGRAATATAMAPGRLIVSSQGDVYFADQASRIRRIDSAGVVTTIAGTGEGGNTGDGGPATAAKILVADMARDAAGNLFFADPEAAKIRKISATGEISTLSLTNVPSGFVPSTLAVNPSGVLHVYDQRNFRLWRVDPQTSALSLVAGTGTQGLAGDGGPATAAQLYNLGDVAFDSAGNLYLSDANVRSINVSTGVITTIAFGTASSSSLPTLGGFPGPLLASSNGQLLIGSGIGDGFQISAQMFNLDLSSKVLTLVAGRGDRAGFAGDGGRATSARFYAPTSVVADAQGNLFVGDRLNGRVRRIDAQTGLVSTVAVGAPTSPTIGQRFPTFTAVAANGDVYYSEWRGHRVMKYSPQTQSVTVVAGTGTAGFSGDGGQATAARLALPWGLAFDEQQNLYISTDGRIRRVATNGVITTVAGCCDSISDAVTPLDGVPALSARLNGGISQLAYRNGKLYFADAANGAIANPVVRELDLASGLIRTIAGNGTFGQSLTNGRALNSPLGQIFGVTTDSSGNVYISETTSSRISRINPTTGEITAIAGGRLGYDGDGGSALDAALYTAQGISFDRRGNLYFADRANHLIRVVLCAAPPESGEASDCDANAPSTSRRRTLVQWNQVGVDQCEAVGAWSGPRAISGAEWLSVPSSGEQVYALRCTKSDGSISLHEATINGTTVVEKPLISARLSGNSLTFGTVRVGESSAVQKLTLTNSGSQPIALDAITKTGDGADAFLVESRCGSTLAAGSSCEIEVTFKPNSSGDKRAQLVAGSGSLKLSATLSGLAETPPATAGSISVSMSSIVFGSVRVGSFSWTRSIIVKNVGASPVSVTPSILGLAADEMTIGNASCLSSISVGAECSVGLTLRPKSSGSKQGQLRLATATGELIVELRGRAGQSENQFVCRADPAQTEPLPSISVFDVSLNGPTSQNASEQKFWMDYTPLPDATSHQLELKWENGGSVFPFFTINNPSFLNPNNSGYCPRLDFVVTAATNNSISVSSGGSAQPCQISITAPFTVGTTKATVRLTASGRTASDTLVIGSSKPDKTPLVASGGGGRVSLTWLRVEGATDYVLYKIEGATATPIAETTDPFKDLNDLVEGTSYTLAVKARSSAGSSAFSNPVTVTPRSVMAVNVQIDDIIVNQAVEVGTGATTKLIAGKPGIVQVYLRVSGDAVGHLGYFTLEAPGLETIAMVGPLMDTPVSTGAGASCVATFDLRDDASTWFASGSRSLKAQAQPVSTSPPTPASSSKVFTFVDERPLYVKLIPVNSVRGNPTSAEIELAKTSIEKQLKAMYPNRSPQIVLSAAPYQFTGTDPGSNFLGELLPKIRDVRSAELSNAGCDRFYYGLHKDNKSLGSRTVGLAYTPPVSSIVASACPPLAGVGVIEYPATVDTTAHEIGHNHGRIHVASSGETNDNCGTPDNADSGYPYLKGRIGVTGYDSAEHRSLSKNRYHDIMSYCSRNWISDYQYRALRTFQEALSVLAPASASMVDARMSAETGGVLFSGSIDVQGVWRLGSRLTLGGRRAVAADASRGFSARVVLTDDTEQTLPLEIVDIDHTARRDFSIWLSNDLAAKEIVVRSRDGSVVFRLDVSTERMTAALSTEAGYRLVGSTVEILPWGSGDRLVIRVRGDEREFVANDGGSETLRLEFKPGDVFEVVATTTERRMLIGPLDGEASSRVIDDSSSSRVIVSVVTGDSSMTGGSAGSNSASQGVFGAPSVTSTELDSGSTSDGGTAPASAFETSVSEDPMTGSRYVLSRSTEPGLGGYAWVLGYRSGSGALLNQWGLQPTAGVLWRRNDVARLLGTSGWVAVCSNQVWVIRDGYQLLAGRTDLGLINRSESEIRVGSDEPAKVVESVSCGSDGRGLTVTGYALPVSADSPALRFGSVAATRFEVNLDEAGLPSGERSEISEFDLGAYCANPVAAERQSFCIQARN